MFPVVLIAISVFLLIFFKIIKRTKYWSNRNVVHEAGLPLIGNMFKVIVRKENFENLIMELYQKYSNHRYFGMFQYNVPVLVLRDPKLIQDFQEEPTSQHELEKLFKMISVQTQNFVKDFKAKEPFAINTKTFFSKYAKDINFLEEDTIYNGLCSMAHVLAINFEVQSKLLDEINKIYQSHSGNITYDVLLSMKYLDKVILETLRLWPTKCETVIVCTKNYKIGDDFHIQKGESILIPIAALQRDRQYYPEPEKFDPERVKFFDLTKEDSKLALKLLFYHLLSKFDIVPLNGTPIPMKLASRKGFRLGLKPRK